MSDLILNNLSDEYKNMNPLLIQCAIICQYMLFYKTAMIVTTNPSSQASNYKTYQMKRFALADFQSHRKLLVLFFSLGLREKKMSRFTV